MVVNSLNNSDSGTKNSKDVLFIYPTDTVWGVGGTIYSKICHEGICKIKGIEKSNPKPVSVLFDSIERLRSFFDLPQIITNEWLSVFFKYESTILFPICWAKKELPSWIVGNSPLVGARCLLGYEGIREIIEQVATPIVSTSLNATGQPPITDRGDAYEFFKKVENSFLKSDLSIDFIDDLAASLSGHSSSIMAINKNCEFSLVRAGCYAEELKEHCGLLSA